MPTPLTTTAPLLLAAVTLAAAPDRLDLGFADGVAGWRIVLDGVMGGRSTGRVDASAPGVLRFTGDLSLENNGGFAQMRSDVSGAQFADARGVELVVRGDGRTYKFNLRCSNARMRAGSYQQSFETDAGTWTTVHLPFDGFRPYAFGRAVAGAPPLDPMQIESIGITLSDKRPGAFQLEIGSIRAKGPEESRADLASQLRAQRLDSILERATTSTPAAPTADLASQLRAQRLDSILERATTSPPAETLAPSRAADATRLLTLAIDRGVPLFNAGQSAACASVYEVAIEGVLALGVDGVGAEVVGRLERARADGASLARWSDRAWMYRHAIDDAYGHLNRSAALH